MSIRGNPKRCPKPCPSVILNVNPNEISCSQTNEIIACNEKIQPVNLQEISEVESNDLIESDIDHVEIFKTMYEEKNEDSFDQNVM